MSLAEERGVCLDKQCFEPESFRVLRRDPRWGRQLVQVPHSRRLVHYLDEERLQKQMLASAKRAEQSRRLKARLAALPSDGTRQQRLALARALLAAHREDP